MSTPVSISFSGSRFATVASWATPVGATAISNAVDAVVTSTAHGLVDGDVVKLAGMASVSATLNDTVWAVNVLSVDAFELVGLDTINFGQYGSGATFAKGNWIESCQNTGYTGDTGATPITKTQTNCGTATTVGDLEHGQVAIPQLASDDVYNAAITAAYFAREQTALRYTWPKNGKYRIDIGYVIQLQNGAAPNGPWTGGFTLERVQRWRDFA
jgi:hypothetical protein